MVFSSDGKQSGISRIKGDFKIQRLTRWHRERQKTTTLHVQLTFEYFFAVFADYDVKMPNFAFYGEERKQATAKFYFSF